MKIEVQEARQQLEQCIREYWTVMTDTQLSSEERTASLRLINEEGQLALGQYKQLSGDTDDSDLVASVPISFTTKGWRITPESNITDALGLLKDWVTALLGVQIAAIGAIAAFLNAKVSLSHWQKFTLVIAALLFSISIYFGGLTLFKLPACAQRKPVATNTANDIYSIVPVGRWNIGRAATWFWWVFVSGIISFFFFIVASSSQ